MEKAGDLLFSPYPIGNELSLALRKRNGNGNGSWMKLKQKGRGTLIQLKNSIIRCCVQFSPENLGISTRCCWGSSMIRKLWDKHEFCNLEMSDAVEVSASWTLTGCYSLVGKFNDRPGVRCLFVRQQKNRIYMDSEGELLIFIGRCSQKEREREIMRERERENLQGFHGRIQAWYLSPKPDQNDQVICSLHARHSRHALHRGTDHRLTWTWNLQTAIGSCKLATPTRLCGDCVRHKLLGRHLATQPEGWHNDSQPLIHAPASLEWHRMDMWRLCCPVFHARRATIQSRDWRMSGKEWTQAALILSLIATEDIEGCGRSAGW